MNFTTSGWIFLVASWGVITVAFVYCMIKTIRGGFKG